MLKAFKLLGDYGLFSFFTLSNKINALGDLWVLWVVWVIGFKSLNVFQRAPHAHYSFTYLYISLYIQI